MAEECKLPPGVVIPQIDPLRCEAKGPCVASCPNSVLSIRAVPKHEKSELSLAHRFKLFVHGGKRAYVVAAEACQGCGLCVQVCPEKAITLSRQK
jgi:NAD-dependent dihydropyrimidine dehydrogenase PreA subunit